jgi:glutathione S-transferase
LQQGMEAPEVIPLRRLERLLFRAWCSWLCNPFRSLQEDQAQQTKFEEIVGLVEASLARTPGPYFLAEFGTADIIFTPYVERMNASLYYYKGYSLREVNPHFNAWFEAMETRPTYRGTQSDFHTHAHDLPPQMGGCWSNETAQALQNQTKVDQGPWLGLPDVTYPEPETSRQEALQRVLKHRQSIIKVNPAAPELIDTSLRCALTHLITGETFTPPTGADVALRYLRDRISVPRDMSIYAAKQLRASLEATASLAGNGQGTPIPIRHRRDQDPANFGTKR